MSGSQTLSSSLKFSTTGVLTVSCLGSDVLAACSDRRFKNCDRENFLRLLGLRQKDLVLVHQVHGARVLVVGSDSVPSDREPADGLLTRSPGLILGIRTADCVPVFLWHPQRRVAGVIHVGWKGLRSGILKQAFQLLDSSFSSDPAAIQIAFGPAIRLCCYEVGAEFQNYFPRFYRKVTDQRGYADLPGAARAELLTLGVKEVHIFDTGICTSCQNATFFSARKEKTEERILSVIQIQNSY